MAGNHLDDCQLLEPAMGHPNPEEADAGRDHCARCSRCRERLEGFKAIIAVIRFSDRTKRDTSPRIRSNDC